jgi:hypothetical protein
MMRKLWCLAIALIAVCAGVTLVGGLTGTWDYNLNTSAWYDGSTGETVITYAPVSFADEFTEKTVDSTNLWNVNTVNSGAAAINVATGGTARLTTGAADNDYVELATPLVWKAGKVCTVEARIALNDAAHTAWAFGLSDAVSEAAGEGEGEGEGESGRRLAITYSTTVLTSTASDFAGFFWDPDGTTDVLRAVCVKANVDGTVVSTSTVLGNGVYHIYRVDLSAAGAVTYWLDGICIGGQEAGITTTAPLCGYVGFMNREAAANTLDIDYIRVWQGTR